MSQNEWTAAIAAADLADWVTVGAYLIAALACTHASRFAWLTRKERDKWFWNLTTVLLIFLGINELLDLQALLTMVGREHAKANGWYGQHRQVQYVFVLSLALIGVVTGIVTLLLTRKARASVRVALIGLGFIGLFVIMRAASFHHLDELLGRKAPLFNWGSVQELLGVAIVGMAALAYPSRRRSKR